MDAVYARVSTNKQSEQEQIPALIKGFNLDKEGVVIFREEVSAWTVDREERREELQRLKQWIKSRSLRRLYIWDLDRLYRNRKRLRDFMNFCFFYGVAVFSLNQKWLNDFQDMANDMPENLRFYMDHIYNLMLDVYGQTAEDESSKKSERVKLKVVKGSDGVTRSVEGKRWGRRSLPDRVVSQVLDAYRAGFSIRHIADSVFYYDHNKNRRKVSRGAVHKIICDYKGVSDT